MNHPRRWPKGTYMQLVSADRLRSFVGPEPKKKMSAVVLARYIDKHPSFINHLTSGRRSSCKPQTATRIAEALGVPLEILFVVEKANVGSTSTNREKVPA
jgi:plasmid maintenance system antidote protein VapI